jgi:RNA polymerase sigma-70 factor (ECF subfamily)
MLIFPCMIMSIGEETDRLFMEKLYRDNHRLMYWAAHKVIGATCDLDDVVADACVSLIRKIHVIREMEGNILRAYVISTVRNTALSHLRAEGRRRARGGDADAEDLASEEPSPLERICALDMAARLMDAIERLPARDQDVLRMKYFSDLTDAEIAEILGIERVTVRVELSRARKRAYQLMMEMEKSGAI